MRILHTSDLHIGKKIMGRERYGEYRSVLSEISDICAAENVDIVLIAGDIFDTYTPSAEAEEIFYNGVKVIAKYSAVLIISGNHDDYVRLTAAASLAEEINVYIVGNDLRKIGCVAHGKTYPIESDSGYVVFGNDKGEKVYINTLPYPNEARFREGNSNESFSDKMRRWIAFGERGKAQKIPSIFLSHIFVAGGKVSDSEREIDLGGARAVPLSLLPECDYCALGHLHGRQKLDKNAYYCGAPMQFTFAESNTVKSVNVFDLMGDGVQGLRQIEICSSRKLIKLQANCIEDGIKILSANAEAYVELTLNLSAPITPTENALLHSCENLVSVKVELFSQNSEETRVSHKNKSSSQLFTDFYKSRYNDDVPDELLRLFLSLTEEE